MVRTSVLVGVLIAIIALAGCSIPRGTSGANQPAQANTQEITYSISGTGKSASNVTYTTDGAGSIEQVSDAKLPWAKTINVPAGFALVSLTAQNGGSGSITCKITRAGQTLKEATSTGRFALASCAGTA